MHVDRVLAGVAPSGPLLSRTMASWPNGCWYSAWLNLPEAPVDSVKDPALARRTTCNCLLVGLATFIFAAGEDDPHPISEIGGDIDQHARPGLQDAEPPERRLDGTLILGSPPRSSTGIDSPPDGFGPTHMQRWLTPLWLTGGAAGRRETGWKVQQTGVSSWLDEVWRRGPQRVRGQLAHHPSAASRPASRRMRACGYRLPGGQPPTLSLSDRSHPSSPAPVAADAPDGLPSQRSLNPTPPSSAARTASPTSSLTYTGPGCSCGIRNTRTPTSASGRNS